MNILPKKSWHVRTKKNIERVRRDEAEAEKATRIEQARHLQVESEARARELRARAGVEEGTSRPDPFSLFEGCKDQIGAEISAEERLKVRENERWMEKVGISKRLVRADDINRPWYSRDRNTDSEECKLNVEKHSGAPSTMSRLLTDMYDPMTAIKNAEELVRTRRRALKLAKPEPKPQPVIPEIVDSESSIEIIEEIRPKSRKEGHRHHTKDAKSSKSRIHKHKSHHRKHKKHKKKG